MSQAQPNPLVFLSYATADRPRVQQFYAPLESAGFDPWLDRKDLLPGQDWEIEIRKQIRKADYFLAFLTNESINKRGFVQKELRLALETMELFPPHAVFFLPIRLEEVNVPEHLSRLHYMDCFGIHDIPTVVNALRNIRDPGRTSSAMADPRTLIREEEFGLKAQRFSKTSAIEIQRAVRKIAREISDDQLAATDRSVLTEERLQFIIESLPEPVAVELLFMFELTLGKWTRAATLSSAQTLEIIYKSAFGDIGIHLTDWSFKPFEDMRFRYGLGDDQWLVRTVFLEALLQLPKHRRDRLFQGIEVISYQPLGSET